MIWPRGMPCSLENRSHDPFDSLYLLKDWYVIYEAKGGELYKYVWRYTKASDKCVTWSVLTPCAMCCDFMNGWAWPP